MPTFYNTGVGGNWPERMTLRTVATLNSQDITGNKSNVTIACYGYYNYEDYNVVNPTEGSYYLKVDEVTKKSGSQNLDFADTSSTNQVLLFTWTGDIAHAADGSKSINVKAYQDCPNVSTLDYLYGSNNWVLPTIPRASAPTLSAPSVPLGSPVTINTNRASDTFKHTLKYAIGSQTGTIATGVDASYAWSPPATIANAIPNAKSGVVMITCETFSGPTLIGSKTVSLTVTVPNTSTYWPTVPLPTVTEGATGLSAFTVRIQGKSKLRVQSSATGKYAATISQYKVVIDGGTYYGADITSAIISKSGTIPVQLTVTDSRGYAVTVTVNVTLEAYSPPKINVFTAKRSPTDQGTDLSAPVDFSISPVANQNTKRYIVRYRVPGGSWTNIIDSTAYYSRIITHSAAGVLNADLSYEIELFVSDYFSSASKIIDISTAFELINFRSTGKGIAFGKVSESDSLEVALDMNLIGAKLKFDGVERPHNKLLASSTNLDTILETGTYYCPSNATVATMTNVPEGNAFSLTVTKHAGVSQVLIPYATDSHRIWHRNNYNGIWGAWQRVDDQGGTVVINELTGATATYSRTNFGYILFGPQNVSYAHIYTDRPAFYFNKELYVNGAQVLTNLSRGGDHLNGWEDLPNGLRRCWKTYTTTILAAAMTATGPTGSFKSGWLNPGTWPAAFTAAPRYVCYDLIATAGAWLWRGSIRDATATAAGDFFIYKFGATDSAIKVFVEAVGPR